MDATALRKLSRAQLQKLAKANNIKANIKSEAIIEALIQLSAQPAPSPPPLVSVKHSQSSPTNSTLAQVSTTPPPRRQPSRKRKAADATPANHVEEVIASPPRPIKTESLSPPPSLPEHYRPDLFPPPTYDSDSSDDDDDASERWVSRVVDIMAKISDGDQQLHEQAMKLREIAIAARRKADDFRALIRSEVGRRMRLHAYLAYWQPVDPKWEWYALWGDRMRRRPDTEQDLWRELETDEESEYEEEPLTKGALATIYARDNEERNKKDRRAILFPEEEKLPSVNTKFKRKYTRKHGWGVEVKRPLILKDQAERPVSLKRLRDSDDDGDDDAQRYHSRPRSCFLADVVCSNSVFEELPERRDKGKSRMTSDEVEAMNAEENSRAEQEVADQEMLELGASLGLTEEEVEQNMVAEYLSHMRDGPEYVRYPPRPSPGPEDEMDRRTRRSTRRRRHRSHHV